MKIRIHIARVQDAKAIESLLKLKARAYSLEFTPNTKHPYELTTTTPEGREAFEAMVTKHLCRYKHVQERGVQGIRFEVV